jgi:hypothetical protein
VPYTDPRNHQKRADEEHPLNPLLNPPLNQLLKPLAPALWLALITGVGAGRFISARMGAKYLNGFAVETIFQSIPVP